MASPPTRPEEVAPEFPVFPLTGALLLPRGKLPLNIFEPRYLAMVEDALAGGRVIGMIQPEPGRPATPTGPALYGVGCLGRLSSFSETEDGRYLITLSGLWRFRLAGEVEMRRGYRRVRGDFAPFRAVDTAEPPESVPFDRDALLVALRAYFQARGFEANWDAIHEMPDDALVATLSMACPFDPAEKQALLEAHAPEDRAATLLALLRMGAHAPSDAPSRRTLS